MKIGIFTSSSGVAGSFPKRVERAIKFLESKGNEIILGDLFYKNDGYRSGTIMERANEINSLISKDVEILMASIGGTNTNSVLPYINYELIDSKRMIICGFSDSTALLNAVKNKCPNARVFYGPALIPSFGDFENEYLEFTYNSFIESIEKKANFTPPNFWTAEKKNWEIFVNKRKSNKNAWSIYNASNKKNISGKIVGGNLNTIISSWSNEFGLKIKKGDILLIEDSQKTIEQLEREFSFLKINRVFLKISGIILGKHELFDDMGTEKKPIDILKEVIGELKVPIIYDVDFSHTKPMMIVELGIKIKIDFIKKLINPIY